jgi:long-chain alkane monooxygenase
MWTHPRDRSTEYNTIRYWQDLARLAERPDPSISDAVQIPVNDPMMVVSVIAHRPVSVHGR